MTDQNEQDPIRRPQNPAFVIFNRTFQEPKPEPTDGRFPPSYEEAIGIGGPSSNVYSPPIDDMVPPSYSPWANPTSEQSYGENFRRSIYSSDPDTPEPYLNVTSVTTR